MAGSCTTSRLVVRRTDGLRGEAAVRYRGTDLAQLVLGVSERIVTVELVVGPAVPEVLAIEDGVDHRRGVAAGHATVMEKGRRLIRSAEVGGIVRIGIVELEHGPDDALRADPVIVDDVRGEEILPGRGHAAAGEDDIGAGMEGAEGPDIGAVVEVTGGACEPAMTAGLFVPEQRLAQH